MHDLLISLCRPNHTDLLNEKLNLMISHEGDIVNWTGRDFAGYRNQLKSGKAAGMDGLTAEHLKFAPDRLDIHLALIFNSLVRHSFLPDIFMPVRIVPIVKNATGDVTSSKNYRPVGIATPNSKILEIAIFDKVS